MYAYNSFEIIQKFLWIGVTNFKSVVRGTMWSRTNNVEDNQRQFRDFYCIQAVVPNLVSRKVIQTKADEKWPKDLQTKDEMPIKVGVASYVLTFSILTTSLSVTSIYE